MATVESSSGLQETSLNRFSTLHPWLSGLAATAPLNGLRNTRWTNKGEKQEIEYTEGPPSG